jgi:hypothetical protein
MVDHTAKLRKLDKELVDFQTGQPASFDLINYSACRLEDSNKIFICGGKKDG